jgi:hypothetical protein
MTEYAELLILEPVARAILEAWETNSFKALGPRIKDLESVLAQIDRTRRAGPSPAEKRRRDKSGAGLLDARHSMTVPRLNRNQSASSS